MGLLEEADAAVEENSAAVAEGSREARHTIGDIVGGDDAPAPDAALNFEDDPRALMYLMSLQPDALMDVVMKQLAEEQQRTLHQRLKVVPAVTRYLPLRPPPAAAGGPHAPPAAWRYLLLRSATCRHAP